MNGSIKKSLKFPFLTHHIKVFKNWYEKAKYKNVKIFKKSKLFQKMSLNNYFQSFLRKALTSWHEKSYEMKTTSPFNNH